MSSKYAEKIRQRKEKLKKNKLPAVLPQPNKNWFWLMFIVLVLAICFLSYQAYSSNLPNELIIALVIIVLLFSALIIWYLPKFYVQSLPNETGKTFDRENAKLKLEDDTRKTFAQIVGGAVLLGGLVFTFNTFRLQQEGQFTDRFTKAITQIGDDKLEVRLGGLYALERIAKDSPKDHPTIMEVLSAYIREQSKEPREKTSKETSQENSKKSDGEIRYEKMNDSTTDILAAATIINRRIIKNDNPKFIFDLSLSNLQQAKLSHAKLPKTSFWASNLYNVNFIEANLESANFTHAFLVMAIFVKANLSRAYFNDADLTQADFRGANLKGASLWNVINFDTATLEMADLSEANLSGCKNLTFFQLSKAIINEKTSLPDYLEDKKAELIETSKRNLEKREKFLKELTNNQ